jgi:two-component system cell cycle response regulator CtrA
MSTLSAAELLRLNRQLTEQVELLQEQIAFLQSALLGDSPLPLEWRLTETEERVMRVILAREYASKDAIMAALYWDKDEPSDEKIVDVLVCKIRKKVQRFGIDVKNQWGRGYYLPREIRRQYRNTFNRRGANDAGTVAKIRSDVA